MLTPFLQFGITAAVIVIAGSFLTRQADRIGHLTGLGGSLAGMVLLAAATSLPELTTSCGAAWIGAGDLAVGGLLGSCLMNLLLLAILDMTHYSRGRMLSSTAAAHALGAAAGIALTALVLLLLLARPAWSLFGWVGLGSLVITVGYLFTLRLVYLNQRVAADSDQAQGAKDGPEPSSGSLRGAVLGYLFAAGAIFAAAPFLAQAADRLAEQTGLGGTFVGTTLVALATSLPEAVTTLSAVRMRAFDLAIGNIFGSNVFNLVILVPVDCFQPGPLFGALSPAHAVTAAWIILVTAVAALGQLYRVEKRYWLFEPDAGLIILLVLIALVMVYLWR